MKIKVKKLDKPIRSGDWHDKPLRWVSEGPNAECQLFATKNDALKYSSIRRKTNTQAEAIKKFSNFV